MAETEIRITGKVDPSVAKAAKEAAKQVEAAAGGATGTTAASVTSGGGAGSKTGEAAKKTAELSKAQQAAQFQAQAMLSKLSKLQEGLAGKSSMTAKSLHETVSQIQNLSKSGSINASVIAKMTAMYEDFIKNSVELPPDELVDLSKEITAAKTALEKTLKTMTAAVPEVKLTISDSSLKAVDALQHKLEVIGAAKNLDAGLLSLEVSAYKVSKTLRNSLLKEIKEIRALMAKPLDAAMSKDIESRANSLAQKLAGAGTKDTAKVGGAGSNVIEALKSLKSATDTTGKSIENIESVWASATASMTGSTANVGKVVEELAKKFPMIGNGIEKVNGIIKGIGPGAMAVFLGIAGAVSFVINKISQCLIEIRNLQDRLKCVAIESEYAKEKTALEILNNERMRENELVEMRLRNIKREVQARQQLAKANLEVAKSLELAGELSENQKKDTEARYTKQSSEMEKRFAEENGRVTIRENEAKMRMLEKEDEILRRSIALEEKRAGKYANINKGEPNLSRTMMTGIASGAAFGAAAGAFWTPVGSAVGGLAGAVTGMFAGLTQYRNQMDLYKKNVAISVESVNQVYEKTREINSHTAKWLESMQENIAALDQISNATKEAEKKDFEAEMAELDKDIGKSRKTEEAAIDQSLRQKLDRFASADRALADRKRKGLVSYEEERAAIGEMMDQVSEELDPINREWATLRDSYLGKSEDEWTPADRHRMAMLEKKREALLSRSRDLAGRSDALIEQGGDVQEYNFTMQQEKREERLGDEARARQRRRNERLGGPMAGQVEAEKEAALWRTRGDETQNELDELLSNYRTKDGKIDFRRLQANQFDNQRFQNLQTWLDQYRSAQYGEEETVKATKDERRERYGQWQLDNRRQGNRLTAMGLGGDVSADFGKQTAGNTKELVTLTREMLKSMAGSRGAPARRNAARITWSM